jgi:hypothetical protein
MHRACRPSMFLSSAALFSIVFNFITIIINIITTTTTTTTIIIPQLDLIFAASYRYFIKSAA